MTLTDKIIAIIPARRGSKGLPKKNMRKLGGQALVDYSIEFAKKFASEIIVSTDIPELLNRQDKDVNYMRRCRETAGDNACIEDVIVETLSKAEMRYETVCLLQPTSPFRKLADLSAMLDMYKKNRNTTLSVNQSSNTILKSFVIIEGVAKSINDVNYLSANRQHLPKVFRPNGSIYLFSKSLFLKYGCFDFENVNIFETESTIDIDTIEDFERAETYLLTAAKEILQVCVKNYQE